MKYMHKTPNGGLHPLCRGNSVYLHLKVDMPILTLHIFNFNWLTLTSEMHFVKFHPEVASCLLSRGKRKYAPLGMRLLWKYIRNCFLVYHFISHSLLYLPNYKEYEAEIFDLQSEKYGLSFDIKKYTTSGWALGDENVIGIRAFNVFQQNSELFDRAADSLSSKLNISTPIWIFYLQMATSRFTQRVTGHHVKNKNIMAASIGHCQKKLPIEVVMNLVEILFFCWVSISVRRPKVVRNLRIFLFVYVCCMFFAEKDALFSFFFFTKIAGPGCLCRMRKCKV